MKHWLHGGETSLRNLVRLCTLHHKFMHEYHYRIELDSDGQPQFFDDRGRPVKDVPARTVRDDLGWEHLIHANRDLPIEPHCCGWDGERIHYNDVCRALYRLDEGEITAKDIL
jgi:hypothetical protein